MRALFALWLCLGLSEGGPLLWPCWGSCWFVPPDFPQQEQGAGWWDCDECAQCGYGDVLADAEGDCAQCPMHFPNAIPIPTMMTNCSDPAQYTCAQGYYNVAPPGGLVCAPCDPALQVKLLGRRMVSQRALTRRGPGNLCLWLLLGALSAWPEGVPAVHQPHSQHHHAAVRPPGGGSSLQRLRR